MQKLDPLETIVQYLIATVLLYLSISFIKLELDLTKWDTVERGFLLLIPVLMTMFYKLIINTINDDE